MKKIFKFNMPTLFDFANTSVVSNKYISTYTYFI